MIGHYVIKYNPKLIMIPISSKIREYCKEHGIRCPDKRLLVAEYLQKENDYVDANKLYLEIRNSKSKISPAGLYQSLNWLIEAGFAECNPGKGNKKSVFKIMNNPVS